MIEDVLHLSMACKILYNMFPKCSFEWKKKDIERDIRYPPIWGTYLYFNSPPFTSHIFMATISGKILLDEDIERNIRLGQDILIQLVRPQHGSKELKVIARQQITELRNRNPDRMESMVHF